MEQLEPAADQLIRETEAVRLLLLSCKGQLPLGSSPFQLLWLSRRRGKKQAVFRPAWPNYHPGFSLCRAEGVRLFSWFVWALNFFQNLGFFFGCNYVSQFALGAVEFHSKFTGLLSKFEWHPAY